MTHRFMGGVRYNMWHKQNCIKRANYTLCDITNRSFEDNTMLAECNDANYHYFFII